MYCTLPVWSATSFSVRTGNGGKLLLHVWPMMSKQSMDAGKGVERGRGKDDVELCSRSSLLLL
jgi:hypothetical protein